IETQKIELPARKTEGGFKDNYLKLAGDLNVCSKRGLSEKFDSTIGAGTVLMPFGGKYQRTPIQAMVQKIAVEKQETDDCSVMSWGFDPYISEKSPYHGAYLAVVQSACKLVATGAEFKDVYLSFQEYFGKPGRDGKRWGQPLAALLGAYRAQKELGIGSIGGKDSMSGSFEDMDVPPTLISFAITTEKTGNIISPEFKKAGDRLYLLAPSYNEDGLPDYRELLAIMDRVADLVRKGSISACYTPGMGGIAEAVMKMAFGNGLGFSYADDVTIDDIFGYNYGAFLLETADELEDARLIGIITEEPAVVYKDESVSLKELEKPYEDKLEGVFPCNIKNKGIMPETESFSCNKRISGSVKAVKPRVLIPVFPGTNCEYDSARAVRAAGGEAEIFIIRNLTSDAIKESIEGFAERLRESQMIFIPGGFSGGDEPDGSGKFITAFFRNEAVKEGVTELLERRDGLMCGICNGFQALIKLGLVPYGKIIDADPESPTLTFNTIGRHQSKIVRTRIVSNMSPWLYDTKVGDIYSAPISHGEGRFYAPEALIKELFKNGQVATQYVDLDGNATNDIQFNPNDSMYAIEGITSPDGRVFGKMGHAERVGEGLYRNVPGNYYIHMFESAVKYFK
ncbi:MAG: phosphoribosylformylglycinamidine synthase subunit PurQ, partial [Lachnospiraceae bacterium]|nr:phosphoribosylformylglycinamidine synthase subunit PurQ [Lachnospiraceae bacterium]